jgi:hypothetical protein
MPVHVEEMTSEVAVFDGDLPLTEEQIDKLVRIVMKRIEQKQRDTASRSAQTRVRRQASSSFEAGE